MGSYALSLQRWSSYINYLEFFCIGDMSIFLHWLIYSIIYFYQYWLMESFYTLGDNAILLTSLIILWLQTTADELQFSSTPLTYLYYSSLWVLFVCLWVLSHFLALQDAPWSSYTFPTTVLESTFYPESPDSFHWRMALETKIWSWGVLIVIRVSLFLDPLGW